MSTFNPTSLFYFTTCLRLEDSETELFHSILETLTREKNTEKDILASIQNIALCDPPFQVYSFPFILDQLSKLNKYNPAVKTQLNAYYDQFTALFEEKKELILDLFDEAFTVSDHEIVTTKLFQLTESLASFHDNRIIGENTIPYIDIVEFAKDAIILAFLNHFCSNQKVLSQLSEYQKNNPDSYLNNLIEDSYLHKRGRLCFLLAIDCKMHLSQIESKEILKNHIWRNIKVSNAPDLEPDLVYLFLTYWFVFFEDKISEEQRKQLLLNEISDLILYNNCLIVSKKSKKGNKIYYEEFYFHDKFINSISILYGNLQEYKDIEKERISISINIWLGSLYLLVSEHLLTENAISILNQFWKPVWLTYGGKSFDSASNKLQLKLADIINSKSGGQTDKKKIFSNNLKILTPWLTYDNSQYDDTYINIDSFHDWIRILYGVTISKKIILNSNKSKQNNFIFYIIHVYHLLSYCSAIFSNQKTIKRELSTSAKIFDTVQNKPNLKKILLQLKRDVNIFLANGDIDELGVENLLIILKESKNSTDKQLVQFLTHVYPVVILDWLYYSTIRKPYENNCQNLIDKLNIYKEFALPKKSLKSFIKLAFIKKFVYREYIHNYIGLDKKNHESILMQTPISLEDIQDYKLVGSQNAKLSEDDANKQKQIDLSFVILTYTFQLNNKCETEICINEFILMIKSIRSEQEISNSNRIALISLFDHFEKINDGNAELFKLIIELVFEINGLLIKSLLTYKIINEFIRTNVFSFNPSQVSVLNCLSTSIAIALKYNIHELNNTDRPKDPLLSIRQSLSITFFRHTLNSIQYICKKYINVTNSIRVQNYYHSNPKSYQIAETNVSLKDNIPHFSYPANIKNIPTQELSLITYNKKEQIAQFYFKHVRIPENTYNFFALSDSEKNIILGDTTKSIFLIAKCLGTVNNYNKLEYKLQIDERTFEYASFKIALELGDLVQLKYFCKTNEKKWLVSYDHCKKILSQKKSSLFIHINQVRDIFFEFNLPLNYWVPSQSDIHTGYINTQIGTDGIRLEIGEDKKPVYRFFNSLIENLNQLDEIIPLTYIDIEWDQDRQEFGYLFYEKFGSYFLLFEDELDYDSSNGVTLPEYIKNEFYEVEIGMPLLNGMIISFQILFNDSKIQLSLYNNNQKEISSNILNRYPLLKTPFDDRNILWNSLFDESETEEYTAKKVNSEWLYEIDDIWRLWGFNQKILVTLNKAITNKKEVDFQLLNGWNKDNGRFDHTIYGEVIERIKINQNQLKRYLNLKPNDQITLKNSAQVSKVSASIISYTVDNFRVSFNWEELSFCPINKDGLGIINHLSKRDFYINYISNWRKSTELLINGFPPEQLLNKTKIVGYFVSVPWEKDLGINSCSIVIENEDDVFSDEYFISVLNRQDKDIKFQLSTYSRFEGKIENNIWHFYLLNRNINLKLAWTLKEIVDSNYDNYFYIGNIRYRGEMKYLFEKENAHGILYYKSKDDHVYKNNELFSKSDQVKTDWIMHPLGKSDQRIGFIFRETIITGSLFNRLNLFSNQILSLKSIVYKFEQLNTDIYFVKRNFTLGMVEIIQKEVLQNTSSLKEKENEKRLINLEEYFVSPYELAGSFDKKTLSIKLSPNNKLKWVLVKGEWVNTLPMISNAEMNIENLVFVPSALSNYHTEDAIFWLSKINNDTFGTFKSGYQTLDDLYKKYQEFSTDIIDLKINKLYFYDKEEIHPITGYPYNQAMFRFESGFGNNILIPENKLLYNGKPISKLELVLTHSDAIKKFCFIKNPEGTNVEKLNILEIERSESFALYSQAINYNIYHIANVKFNKKVVSVNSIRGVDIYSLNSSKMTYEYRHLGATLHETDNITIKNRFEKEPQVENRNILVKVDTNYFSRTGRLKFKHCKLTFIEGKDYECLKATLLEDGKSIYPRIIMELGEIGITFSKNDYLIEINPISIIDAEDIGDDFKNGKILRREFSLNEGLLREYFRRHQTDFFEGYEAYVTVFPKKGNRNMITYSLVLNSDFRPQDVLYPFKRFVGISKWNNFRNQDLTIEIKPGNFIRIKNIALTLNTESIKAGDVLDISVENKKFIIDSAFASDNRYLFNDRPVAILPKDAAFNIDDSINRPLTLGGLPNIELDFLPSVINEKKLLLKTHHPKIAFLSDQQNNFYVKLVPKNKSITSGYILINNSDKSLVFISLHDNIQYNIDINNLSFIDDSINGIIDRIEKCTWKYHDEKSNNLVKDGSGFSKGELYNLLPSTISALDTSRFSRGPIFTEIVSKSAILRYRSNLIFWSFPVSSLVDFLDNNGKHYTFAYAGKCDNLHFIEIAPGRIVELPINLLIFKNGSIEIPLKDYAWDFLVPGDEITLSNLTKELTDLYKIQLIKIKHSFRNALSKSSKLPILKIDEKQGFILLGVKNFTLCLPTYNASQFIISKPVEYLVDSNLIVSQKHSIYLGNENTVLISCDDKGFFLLGFDNIRPRYINPSKSNFIKNLIKACGRAIPAQLLQENKGDCLKFKPVSILDIIQNLPNKYLSGEIVNALNNSFQELVIKIGGFIEIVPFDIILSGVAIQDRESAVHGLIGLQVWLKLELSNGVININTGFEQDSIDSEIYVKKISHILDANGSFIGTICQASKSQKYYWIPENEMAWCSVENEVADYVFSNFSDKGVQGLKPIKVCICNNGSIFISRIRTKELINSFNRKKCSSDSIDVYQITKPVLNEVGNFTLFGYSILHNVLINVTVSEISLPVNEMIMRTEVVDKNYTELKIHTQYGNKKILVYIPLYKFKLFDEIDVQNKMNLMAVLYDNNINSLKANSTVIISISESIVSGMNVKNYNLETGFAVLKSLCLLQNYSSNGQYIQLIYRVLEVIKLNLLRQICFETINEQEINTFHDHYLDYVLYDAIKPFYESAEIELTEQAFFKMKKLALTLCFNNQDPRYPAIGNALLQALGYESNLSWEILNKSNLFGFLRKLSTFSVKNFKTNVKIDYQFISFINEAIEKIKQNRIELKLLNERLV